MGVLGSHRSIQFNMGVLGSHRSIQFNIWEFLVHTEAYNLIYGSSWFTQKHTI